MPIIMHYDMQLLAPEAMPGVKFSGRDSLVNQFPRTIRPSCFPVLFLTALYLHNSVGVFTFIHQMKLNHYYIRYEFMIREGAKNILRGDV